MSYLDDINTRRQEKAERRKYASRTVHKIGPGEIELAIHYLAGQLGISEVAEVLGITNSTGAYGVMARALKQAYQEGYIKVVTDEQ